MSSLLIRQFIKRCSMRETPQPGNGYLFFLKRNLNSVKTPWTRGQFAWALSSSETQRSAFSSVNNLILKDKDFINWLVGVIDGDGTFSFSRSKKGYWGFHFGVAQSSYNLKLLCYIKQKLKIGSVTVVEKNTAAIYRVRNKKHIIENIIPIFDAFPLLTSKHFKYVNFKKALLISNEPLLSPSRKDELISELREQNIIPKGYKSPVWHFIPEGYESPDWNYKKTSSNLKKLAKKVINKFWLVGFIEAEGSFYITKKDSNRMGHGFAVTQKLDKHVLWAISLVLEIQTGVVRKKTHNSVVTYKAETIQYIIKYFFKTMKGMKAVEYRIWSRSFSKRARGFKYLLKIQQKMRTLRAKRFDKFGKSYQKKNKSGGMKV